MVVHNDEIKVAQYSQWDGYPSGQGKTVCEFIRHKMSSDFVNKVDALRHVTDKELETDKDLASLPEFSRNAGADILEMIQSGKVPSVHLSTSFAAASLFCEWAYLVDLDNDVLEVYKGFNTTELKEVDRFLYLEEYSDAGYHPVKLLCKFSFTDLKACWDTSESWAAAVTKLSAANNSDED